MPGNLHGAELIFLVVPQQVVNCESGNGQSSRDCLLSQATGEQVHRPSGHDSFNFIHKPGAFSDTGSFFSGGQSQTSPVAGLEPFTQARKNSKSLTQHPCRHSSAHSPKTSHAQRGDRTPVASGGTINQVVPFTVGGHDGVSLFLRLQRTLSDGNNAKAEIVQNLVDCLRSFTHTRQGVLVVVAVERVVGRHRIRCRTGHGTFVAEDGGPQALRFLLGGVDRVTHGLLVSVGVASESSPLQNRCVGRFPGVNRRVLLTKNLMDIFGRFGVDLARLNLSLQPPLPRVVSRQSASVVTLVPVQHLLKIVGGRPKLNLGIFVVLFFGRSNLGNNLFNRVRQHLA